LIGQTSVARARPNTFNSLPYKTTGPTWRGDIKAERRKKIQSGFEGLTNETICGGTVILGIVSPDLLDVSTIPGGGKLPGVRP
jgi:hypothetical protein